MILIAKSLSLMILSVFKVKKVQNGTIPDFFKKNEKKKGFWIQNNKKSIFRWIYTFFIRFFIEKLVKNTHFFYTFFYTFFMRFFNRKTASLEIKKLLYHDSFSVRFFYAFFTFFLRFLIILFLVKNKKRTKNG